MLWHRSSDASHYQARAGLGRSHGGESIAADQPLVRFLIETKWIIDLREFRSEPSSHPGLTLEGLEQLFEFAAFVIPLLHDEELVGFVVLDAPDSMLALNFEDHDILKTAGQQIARDLAQAEASEKLSQTLQFEAFNKLTAYIMHDLKNAIAQQSLVVENAEKHRHNPAFIDDTIDTIARSVARMKRLMTQLASRSKSPVNRRVRIREQTDLAVERSAGRQPNPRVESSRENIVVLADPERLSMVIEHLLRNAQEATSPTGQVVVGTRLHNDSVIITITDTGCGMTPEFIRDRLFRPFDSTKGSESMGIGAYQARDYAAALGGRLEVSSIVGEGTEFRLTLPLAN